MDCNRLTFQDSLDFLGVTTLNGIHGDKAPSSEDLIEIEYTSGKRANSRCADVVQLPVQNPKSLAIKSGCSVKSTLGQSLKSLFNN